jgi:hypothetical protein
MRPTWRRRSGDPSTDRTYSAEIRQSVSRRAHGVDPVTSKKIVLPFRRRKVTLAHLGTLNVAADGTPRPEDLVTFWEHALLAIGRLELPAEAGAALAARTVARMPELRARAALKRALSRAQGEAKAPAKPARKR